ncbi:hypothetical protein [Bifidobacterium aquikefiri]|uniref:hypothetical protein n=1 Tax=Bifidobacterium aquikefiri TaxID=1653207 RepID=UPI001303BFB9|nr:hypothetical protein [Bifidobacterium aquikefiri]
MGYQQVGYLIGPLRSLGMTGEEQGIYWNELHASTPAKTKNPHFYAYNPQEL